MYNTSTGSRGQNRLVPMIVSVIVVLVVLGAVASQLGLVAGIGDFWVTHFSEPEAEYYKSGMTRMNTRKEREVEAAVQDFTNAIKVNPNYSPAYIQRSTAYWLLGFKEESLADLDKAIEVDPQNPEIYYQRTFILTLLGKDSSFRYLAEQERIWSAYEPRHLWGDEL